MANGTTGNKEKWSFAAGIPLLNVEMDGELIKNLIVFAGQDWENETETILFTDLDANGRSVWGKRVK